jgi:hypothetical protein
MIPPTVRRDGFTESHRVVVLCEVKYFKVAVYRVDTQ